MAPMSFRRLSTAVTAALAVAVAVPAAAQACGTQPLAQPLLTVGDEGWYLPVDNAGFEKGTNDWKLRNGAVVRENEPWKVLGGTQSLRLNAGGSALSDEVCVTLDHTHSRFFARALTATGTLRVDVLWDNEGDDHEVTVLTLDASGFRAWAPTPTATMAQAVRSLFEDEADELVALRLTAVSGAWLVDDVLVDPYRRR